MAIICTHAKPTQKMQKINNIKINDNIMRYDAKYMMRINFKFNEKKNENKTNAPECQRVLKNIDFFFVFEK